MSRNVIDVNKLLNEDFKKAAKEIQSLQSFEKLDNTVLLELYSYYKQVTVGDNKTSQPSFLDFKGQAKWSAWNERKGMKRETAQVKYIKLVAKILDSFNFKKCF
jgi:diazepam-binding inhibitor (GABA receptor modulating acyl-CoA-binding protein)